MIKNQIVKVNLKGGLIGLIAGNTQKAIQKRFDELNTDGWHVRSLVADTSGNLVTYFLRMIVLIITLFLYMPINGYFIICEKETQEDKRD